MNNLKTTDIKGKKYVEVNERIKYLRQHFAGYSLLSELVKLENGVCIFKAILLNNEGVEVANGFAYEKEGSSFINKTSYIENCETSAWGRCLGNFGIGIDTSVASADEVINAIENQKPVNQKKEQVQLTFKDRLVALTDRKQENITLITKLLNGRKADEIATGEQESFLRIAAKAITANSEIEEDAENIERE